MRPAVSFIPPEEGGDVVDLCAQAMVSASPPLQAGAVEEEIANVRLNLMHDLIPISRFYAASIMDLLETFPPLEGFPLHAFLCRLAKTDFSKEALYRAIEEKNDTESGPNLFEQVNEWGYVSVPAALNGEKLSDPLQLDLQKSGEGTVETIGSIIAMLRQLDNPEERSLIIQACCRVLELRVHFDFRKNKES